jgi:hypothetical protein
MNNFEFKNYVVNLPYNKLLDYSVSILKGSQDNLAQFKKTLERYKKLDYNRLQKDYDEKMEYIVEYPRNTIENFKIQYQIVIDKCTKTNAREDIELCKRIIENMNEANKNYDEASIVIDNTANFLNNSIRLKPTLAELAYETIKRKNIPINENDNFATNAIEQVKFMQSKRGGKYRKKTNKKSKRYKRKTAKKYIRK